MRTVYILVEGPTEEEYVINSIAHYLKGFNIVNTVPIRIETSPGYSGGDVTFARYERDARNLLQTDPNCIVTSIIDFYELRTDFPGYGAASEMASRHDRVAHIESQISTSINDERLIPYIQLHEFEALLFADIKGFQTYFPKVVNHAKYIINHNPDPEMINDSPETTPAARLKGIFNRVSLRYIKTFHGPLIALENGINPVLDKCPRFKGWIEKVIEKATT